RRQRGIRGPEVRQRRPQRHRLRHLNPSPSNVGWERVLWHPSLPGVGTMEGMANEPGWYPDPWQPARRRWWDGTSWGDHTWDPNQPTQPAQQPERPRPGFWMPPPDPWRDLAE